MQTGRCLCGAVTWELTGDLIATAICHCDHCQRQSGGAFSVNLIALESQLSVSGDLKTYEDRGEHGDDVYVRRRFCAFVRLTDRVGAREDRRRGRREGGHARRQVSCPTGRRGLVRRPPALGLAARHRGVARPRVVPWRTDLDRLADPLAKLDADEVSGAREERVAHAGIHAPELTFADRHRVGGALHVRIVAAEREQLRHLFENSGDRLRCRER